MRVHLGLFTDFYELTMMQGYFLDGRAGEPATFDYFFRKNPFGGSFTIFAGLSDLLECIPKVTFSPSDLDYLKAQGFHDSFLDYLRDFQFKGTIYSVEEGEVVFPDEPVLSIRGSFAEVQLLETLVLNILNFQSLVATKAARIRHAAGDKAFIDFGLRRAQGWGGIAASKAAIIGGADATSNVLSARDNDLPTSGTMAHSWVQSYEDEYEAFLKFARIYRERSILLVDTYDTVGSGIPNAIKVARELAAEGIRIRGVRLDSGDLDQLSRKSRIMLDNAGLHELIIVVSNQQDEHTIKQLLDNGAPIDGFGVGTSLIVGRPDAALDGVYKLSVINGQPTLKLSESVEKITIPGNKKLARYYDTKGQPLMDAILLDNESKPGKLRRKNGEIIEPPPNSIFKELTSPVMTKGQPLLAPIRVEGIVEKVGAQMALLPTHYKDLENPGNYQTALTENLFVMMQDEIKNQRSTSYERTDGS